MNYYDFMKAKSSWSWEKNINQQDFKKVGNFPLDFGQDIESCKATALDWRWKDLETLNIDADVGPLEKPINIKKISNSLGDDAPVNLFRSNPVRTPNIQRMVEILGMRDTNIRFLNQAPGRITNLHVDTFYKKDSNGTFSSIDRELDTVCRFIVMLSDWEFGQISIFGNSHWTHWKAGDVITFKASDVPHAAANTGWHERNSLVISGFLTSMTQRLLSAADQFPNQNLLEGMLE